jgi:hypothetical protein
MMLCARNEWILVLIWLVIGTSLLHAQQPPGPPTSLPAYRPPALALVQPAAGGSLPGDKPVLVFRFAPGEPNDPIDAQSFAVTVDGVDRTTRFQVTAAEAWGTLADSEEGGATAGAYQVSARICSTRGACAAVSATVPVVESARASPAPAEGSSGARRRKVMDAVVAVIRKLLEP